MSQLATSHNEDYVLQEVKLKFIAEARWRNFWCVWGDNNKLLFIEQHFHLNDHNFTIIERIEKTIKNALGNIIAIIETKKNG